MTVRDGEYGEEEESARPRKTRLLGREREYPGSEELGSEENWNMSIQNVRDIQKNKAGYTAIQSRTVGQEQ